MANTSHVNNFYLMEMDPVLQALALTTPSSSDL